MLGAVVDSSLKRIENDAAVVRWNSQTAVESERRKVLENARVEAVVNGILNEGEARETWLGDAGVARHRRKDGLGEA